MQHELNSKMNQSTSNVERKPKRASFEAAVKKLEGNSKKSLTNVKINTRKRKEEEASLKCKQQERSKIQEEIVHLKGQLQYDSVQMPPIELNLSKIGKKKKEIENYTDKIKTTLPNFSNDSLDVKEKLIEHKKSVHELLKNFKHKNEQIEKERMLLEEQSQEIKEEFQKSIECYNSNGLNLCGNLKKLQRNVNILQNNLKQVNTDNEKITFKIKSIQEEKVQLIQEMEEKQKQKDKLLNEIKEQQRVFEKRQLEISQDLNNLFAKTQEKEKDQKNFEVEKLKQKNEKLNITRKLEHLQKDNFELKLTNEDLANKFHQLEVQLNEDTRKMESELTAKMKENEESQNFNINLQGVLEDLEKKLDITKNLKEELNLKIEEKKSNIGELNIKYHQIQQFVIDHVEEINKQMQEYEQIQQEITFVKEEYSKKQNEYEKEKVQKESEIKDIEREIEALNEKNQKTLSEMKESSDQLVIKFTEQTKNEMKQFEDESHVIISKNLYLQEKLDNDNNAIKLLQKEIAQTDEVLKNLQEIIKLLKPVEKNEQKSVKKQKSTSCYSQPVGSAPSSRPAPKKPKKRMSSTEGNSLDVKTFTAIRQKQLLNKRKRRNE